MTQGQIVTSKDGYKRKILGICGGVTFLSRANNFDAYGAAWAERELIAEGWQLPKEEWVPEKDEWYFWITVEGRVIKSIWDNSSADNNIKSFLGIFKTREEAEKRLEEIKNLLK